MAANAGVDGRVERCAYCNGALRLVLVERENPTSMIRSAARRGRYLAEVIQKLYEVADSDRGHTALCDSPEKGRGGQ